jgi:hypothetical protein
MATLPWVQNGQGWQYLSYAVAALEIFPDEQKQTFPTGKPDQQIISDCIKHAFSEGLTKVTLMLKTKGYVPEDYLAAFDICHSLYTADDIAPLASAWLEWKATEPCIRPSVPNEWYQPYPRASRSARQAPRSPT